MSGFVQPCDEAVISAKGADALCRAASRRWVLAATILGSSMAFIDGTVVNVALAALQRDFNATVADVQWVVEGYSLLLTSLLLVGGSLGDRYGRRRIFLLGVTVFSCASLLCALAANVQQLIAARALQGAGAALLVPGSLAIIGAAFEGESRGRAIGTWAGFTAITTAVGPVLGGWLIDHLSWRAIFLINIPVALAVWLISSRHLAESRDSSETGRLDWFGAALVTVGLGALVYGLIRASQTGFHQATVLFSLAAAVLLLATFLFLEARTNHPMLPLPLFRSRNFTAANLLTLLLYSALGGSLFFLPLNLIQVQGYGATAAGAALLPFVLIMFLLSRWAGGLVKRFGARIPLVIGPMIAAVGFGLLAVPDVGTNFWIGFFPAVLVLGLGMTISVAPLTTTVMNAVPSQRMGVASGINNTVARAASLLAIAVFGIVMLDVFGRVLDSRLSILNAPLEVKQEIKDQRTRLAAIQIRKNASPALRDEIRDAINQSFIAGFRTIMLVGTVLAFASGVISLLLIERTDRAGSQRS
jgi:EmrB/QacA subfamily drug resistance transporter